MICVCYCSTDTRASPTPRGALACGRKNVSLHHRWRWVTFHRGGIYIPATMNSCKTAHKQSDAQNMCSGSAYLCQTWFMRTWLTPNMIISLAMGVKQAIGCAGIQVRPHCLKQTSKQTDLSATTHRYHTKKSYQRLSCPTSGWGLEACHALYLIWPSRYWMIKVYRHFSLKQK